MEVELAEAEDHVKGEEEVENAQDSETVEAYVVPAVDEDGLPGTPRRMRAYMRYVLLFI